MSLPLPHIVAWNLTARCSLACPHCYLSAGPDASAEGEIVLHRVGECKWDDDAFVQFVEELAGEAPDAPSDSAPSDEEVSEEDAT